MWSLPLCQFQISFQSCLFALLTYGVSRLHSQHVGHNESYQRHDHELGDKPGQGSHRFLHVVFDVFQLHFGPHGDHDEDEDKNVDRGKGILQCRV